MKSKLSAKQGVDKHSKHSARRGRCLEWDLNPWSRPYSLSVCTIIVLITVGTCTLMTSEKPKQASTTSARDTGEGTIYMYTYSVMLKIASSVRNAKP